MKKILFHFLNRLELKFFGNYDGNYAPVSGAVALSALAAAVVSMVVIFILQMVNADPETGKIVLGCAYGAAFLFSAWRTYKVMCGLPSTGMKAGLAAYVLFLFCVCALLFLYLVMWAIIIAVALFILWLILKGSGQGSGRVTYSDGSSESIRSTGKGITGETYYESESGRTFVD